MSDEQTDEQTERGPRPDPSIEPGEPEPGGADARPEAPAEAEHAGEPVSRDLDPDRNPAVEDALPGEMKETEDTGTKATRGEEDEGDTEVSPGTGSDEAPA